MRFLLDTNVISDLMRNPNGRVRARISEVGESTVFTSIVVLAELRFGVERVASSRLAQRLDVVLTELPVEGLAPPIDKRYAAVRAALERIGRPISQNDLLIAAHALALDAVLVTDNEKEFSRVPGLTIENWLRA